MDLFLQQLFNGLALGATYGMFALGFGLVFATMGILNVAHGTFATWGALIALYAVAGMGLPFIPGLILGVVGAGLLGVLVDQIAFEPLRRRDAGLLGPIITSIGMWIILGALAQIATNSTARRFPIGTFPERLFEIGPLRLELVQIVNIVVALALAITLYLFMERSRFGSAIRAVGFDANSAAISGVNPRIVIYVTAFLASAVAAIAGILSGLATNNVSFTLGEGLLLKGFAAVVVGGFGDVRGAMVGGMIIGVSEVLGAQYISNSFRDAITFGLLLLFLVLRPRGIFSELQYSRA